MTRIKIDDIHEERKIGVEELKAVIGGGALPGMFETGQISMLDPQIRAMGTGAGAFSAGRVLPQVDPSKLMK